MEENHITLKADSKDELNKQIDEKLKQDYLLAGGMYTDENGVLSQNMSRPNNIDSEITPKGMLFILVYLGFMIYFMFFVM